VASGPLPIEDIYPLFPGEWVLAKVTALAGGRISEAQVLAHSHSRQAISAALAEAHEENPRVHAYLFLGGSRAATAEEWARQLTQAAGDPLNASW
jgi:hypothetical protein